MKVIASLGVCAMFLVTPGLASSRAQTQQPAETPSLGAVARKLKAERARENRKPAAVYTNDNIPSGAALQTESDTGQAANAAESSKAASAPSPDKSSGEHGEKYFRSEADSIRSRLDLHQRELAVLQQKLGISSTGYYPDPQKTLDQESTPVFHADVNKLRDEIEAKKQQIADDEKAMDNLQDELRRVGGDPGWIR